MPAPLQRPCPWANGEEASRAGPAGLWDPQRGVRFKRKKIFLTKNEREEKETEGFKRKEYYKIIINNNNSNLFHIILEKKRKNY